MDKQNPLDEVTSRDFIIDALMVCLVISMCGLCAYVGITYFGAPDFIKTTETNKSKPVECHVYYHQHKQTHEWKGELK